jgi:cob(I)alamin adenosyltransferase
VVLVQFLKGSDTGELHALERLRDVTVLRYPRSFGFYPSANEQDKKEMTRLNNAYLAEARRLAAEGRCDVLVLDEICAAYALGSLDTALADRLVLDKPPHMELILTGRKPPEHFLKAADYVTVCKKGKHPFDSGVPAREGIEF